MIMLEKLSEIELKLCYKFKDKSLIETAFTHSSFAYAQNKASNERLEFLGDSVLNFCTTKYLYENFNFNEGESSKIRAYLVSSENVSKFVAKNELEKSLLCDNFNPEKSTNVMGDLYESILGAIFLDSGINSCEKFVFFSLNFSKKLVESVHLLSHDYKTELQEKLQANGSKKLEYKLLEKKGPAHCPQFYMEVLIDGKIFGEAVGNSKKEAENIV